MFDAVITTVLVPSLGILLFNDTKAGLSEKKGRQFSSPLWGFFYLMIEKNCYIVVKKLFSSPLWGFFYLILGRKTFKALFPFSSPLWGFFYLIEIGAPIIEDPLTFSSPLWGFFYLIIHQLYE